jgi:hypothetical protein
VTTDASHPADSTPTTYKRRPVYEESPFTVPGAIPIKIKRKTIKGGECAMVHHKTGEVIADIAGFYEYQEVDGEKFVKLFVQGIAAMEGLTPPGVKVFTILYKEMGNNPGKDRLHLAYSALSVAERGRIGASTFARGLAELIEKKFIAATPSTGLFWLNLNYAFNGNRLNFVKSFRKKGAAARAEIEGQQSLFYEGGVKLIESEQPAEQ